MTLVGTYRLPVFRQEFHQRHPWEWTPLAEKQWTHDGRKLTGVSHMLLYSYFDDRAAIIQSLRERGFEQMEAFCAESLRRAETGDALVQVRESLGRFIQISHEHPMLYQLAWRRATSWRADPQHVTTILEHLSQLIRLCIERGQCIERDPGLAGFNLVFINVYDEGQAYTEEEHREWLEEAGFSEFERLLLPNTSSIITARKTK